MDNEGNVSLQFSGDGGLETTLTLEALGTRLKTLLVLRPLESTPDARVDDYIKPYEKNWFWQLALKDWRRYSDIMLVALVANVLALSGMVFSMQVYDRVVPSQSSHAVGAVWRRDDCHRVRIHHAHAARAYF
jgi:ATP-binding cassette subfamily C protein LapB